MAKNGQGKLGDFRPSAPGRNANRHTARGMGMLADSIRKDGYLTPLTVAADGEAIDGSARLETVADVMGLDVDPIIVRSDGTRPVIHVREDIPDATDPRAVRLALAANRIGQVNLDFDADVLAAIAEAGEVDLSALWRDEELAEVLAGVDAEWPDGLGLPDGDKPPFRQMTFTVHDEQAGVIESALAAAKANGGARSDLNENTNGNALAYVCAAFGAGHER